MTQASAKQRLDKVSEDAMCTGCGLCQSLLGVDKVQMQIVENGHERPVVVGQLTDDDVDAVERVCPGTRLQGLPSALVDERSKHDAIWGDYHHMVKAWSAEPDVRHQGSTGGALTALARYLVDSGEVDGVLHANDQHENPTFGAATLSTDKDQVLAAAGSRYGPTAVLADVHALLEQEGGTYAFVGKPCDVAALRNLADVDPRVNEKFSFMMAMVCGGYRSPKAANAFLRDEMGLELAEIDKLRYRGFGCPGPTTLTLKDGSQIEKTYEDFWGTDESMWDIPWRCKVCADGIGEAADFAAADDWQGGAPDMSKADDDPGENACVVRTTAAAQMVERAVEAGFLATGEVLDPRYMDSVQPHQRNKKLKAGVRHQAMQAAGHTTPVSERLRLDELSASLDEADFRAEHQGTAERIKIGKASEPTPR